jgi:SAM-dependent methyltransferase
MKMIVIFKTDIQDQNQADKVYRALKNILPDAKINFDLEDCDKILRIENLNVDSSTVVSVLEELGFLGKPMPDKVCENLTSSSAGMKGFWDSSFIEHKAMWGFEPTNSAVIAKDLFIAQGIKDVLIPGIGYGRNARVFMENDIKVTGIEISPTAIEMAKEYYSSDMEIFQGSVTDMPFDTHLYEGVFCYGLVYLLNPEQRKKMISDSYNQLEPGGWMVFSVVSKNSSNYGKGKEVGKDTFEIGKGGQVFFYDMDTVKLDFEKYGLVDSFEIDEPNKALVNQSSFRFILIKCKKEN